MSDIIKSNFISFSDQKREIRTIDINDPNVLKSSLKTKTNAPKAHIKPSNESLSLDDLGLNLDSLKEEINETEDTSIVLSEEHLKEIESLKEESINKGYEEGFAKGKTDGYNDGYQDGKNQAEEDLNKALEAYKVEQETIQTNFKNKLMDEYNGYKKELEPKMLTIIEDLVTKIIGVEKMSKGTILHLIKCGLNELELHGDLVIKVSSDDIDYVLEHKNELTEEISEKIKVEILKDQQLNQNECIIETEMGTIDCSLGTQLEGLFKELRLIKNSLLVD